MTHGTFHWAAAIALTFAHSAALLASPEVPSCGPEQAGWIDGAVAVDQAPVDLRRRDEAPAGKHGFIAARGESFVFADGTPARFWGANVAASSLFQSDDALIDEHAERIAKLGFNLVRLHHHDSNGWVERTLIAGGRGDTRAFDPEAFRKLDRWVAKLKEHGVYVWLDLHTGRKFKAGDEIPGFAELRGARPGSGNAKGFLYLNARLQELVLEFAKGFLEHRNAITGLRYADDPALIAILITNENDVTHHFGSLFAKPKLNPWHFQRYNEEAKAFALRTGLPSKGMHQPWTPLGKVLLADLEHRFDVRARRVIRELGAKAPIALTSYWGQSPLSTLPSLSAGDWVDVHDYVNDNPLSVDPRKYGGMAARIGGGQLTGRPLTVSEWNHGDPLQRERFMSPLWIASVASLQDWDGLMLYAYSMSRLGRVSRSPWNAVGDPATIALMPAASLLYRRGDVAPARKRFVLTPAANVVFDKASAPARLPAIATLVEQSRIAIELPKVPGLPWLTAAPPGPGERVVDLNRSFLGAAATFVRSDTGELRRDFDPGFQSIDTARSQVAAGALAGRDVATTRMRVRSQTDAAIAFTSLDGLPLETSRSVLATVVGRACTAGPRGMRWRTEPVRGSVSLRSEGSRVLVPLGPAGERRAPRRLARVDGELEIPLEFGAVWALLEPADASR